jgi:cell division septation protein DedD
MKTTAYVAALVCVLAVALGGCKPKQSAYQKVYEAAQSRSTVYQAEPAQATPEATSIQTERITATDGRGIQRYSVVIGSFLSKTNAESLKNRMQTAGYTPVLAQNEQGMYRVLVATFDDKTEAYRQQAAIKERFPEFHDAWLLERLY